MIDCVLHSKGSPVGRYGTVLSAEVVENERGSKGFGFVTLTTADACDKARVALNGTLMGGRRIEVFFFSLWKSLQNKVSSDSVVLKLFGLFHVS